MRGLQGGLSVLVALLAMATADPAAARTERIRWKYSAPGRGEASRSTWAPHRASTAGDRRGKPTPYGNVYEYGLEVADDAVVFVGDQRIRRQRRASALSNEVRHKPADGGGGGGGRRWR